MKKSFLSQCLLTNSMIVKKDLEYPVVTQPKLDGIRCIIRKTNEVVEAHTRNGKKIDAIPHILHSLEEFFKENPYAILDGELYNHDLRDNFNKITSLVRKQKPVRTKNDTDNSFKKERKRIYRTMRRSKKNY